MDLLRSTLSQALSGTAAALSLTSRVLEVTAEVVRPSRPAADEPPAGAEPEPTDADLGLGGDRNAPPPAPDVGEPAAVEELTDAELGLAPVDGADDAAHSRSPESSIEALAMQSASAVVAAVDDLSTDELRLLVEYETTHRNRRTVLQAVERVLTPQ